MGHRERQTILHCMSHKHDVQWEGVGRSV